MDNSNRRSIAGLNWVFVAIQAQVHWASDCGHAHVELAERIEKAVPGTEIGHLAESGSAR